MGATHEGIGFAGVLGDMPRMGSRGVDEEIEHLRRQGKEVLKLLPLPDMATPAHIIEAAQAAAARPQSPPARGLPELRQGIAERLHAEMGIEIDPEAEVLVTYGAMHALFVTINALLDDGDEVLVPAPSYFIDGIVAMARGRLNCVLMSEDEGYRLDLEKLERAISPRTRVLFLVTPQNPTGYVLTGDDLRGVAGLAERHNLVVISDESYDKLVYDGRRHLSPISLPQARERTVLIRSFTKSYVMPQWRVGYIVAPAALTRQFLKVLEWMCLYGSYVPQKAAAAAISGPQEWTEKGRIKMQVGRDTFYESICHMEGISAVKPQGGPFFFLNISALSTDDEEFHHRLLRDYGVPTVPGRLMKQADHLRLRFGGRPDVLKQALDRLREAVLEVRG